MSKLARGISGNTWPSYISLHINAGPPPRIATTRYVRVKCSQVSQIPTNGKHQYHSTQQAPRVSPTQHIFIQPPARQLDLEALQIDPQSPVQWPSSSSTQADKCYGEALQEFRNVSPERSFTVWPCETSASRTYFPDHQRCHQKLVAAAKASRHDDDRFLIGQMISDFLRPSHLAANFWPDLQICGNIRSAFGLRMYASGNHASIAS